MELFVLFHQEVNSLREEINSKMSQQHNPSQSKDLESKYEEQEESPEDDDYILDMLSYITNPTKGSNTPSRYQQELSDLSRDMEQSSNRQEEPSVSILKSAHPSRSDLKSTSKVENSLSQCK